MREELERYRALKREEMDLLARMRRATLAAREAGDAAERRRAEEEAAIYRRAAERAEKRWRAIEEAIEALPDPRAREVVRMRYIDGKSRVSVSVRLGISERGVSRIAARALAEMERAWRR